MKNAIYGMAASIAPGVRLLALAASCASTGAVNLFGAGGLLGDGNRVAVRESLVVRRQAGHVAALLPGIPACDAKRNEQGTRGRQHVSVTDEVPAARLRLVRAQAVRSWRVPV